MNAFRVIECLERMDILGGQNTENFEKNLQYFDLNHSEEVTNLDLFSKLRTKEIIN